MNWLRMILTLFETIRSVLKLQTFSSLQPTARNNFVDFA